MSRLPLLVVAALFAFLSVQSFANAQAMSYRYVPWRQDPGVNVYLSQRYDYLLETSWRFRHYRMWKECRTVNFTPALHGDCIGSFDQYEPFRGGY